MLDEDLLEVTIWEMQFSEMSFNIAGSSIMDFIKCNSLVFDVSSKILSVLVEFSQIELSNAIYLKPLKHENFE